ncbi:hypothetical protein [Absidia glauca]|uniref:Uncharacterized protein n=1 Tax=Absidia glauca TaxID=4829 RepID=A0A168NKL0_ABSGL|nr:hypothetical protein [Absidia glauca]
MVMKLTLLSIVLAASLVTALPREYSDVKKVAKFDQRSLKNAHGDLNVAGIAHVDKRGPTDAFKDVGKALDNFFGSSRQSRSKNGADGVGAAAGGPGEAAGGVGNAAQGAPIGPGE